MNLRKLLENVKINEGEFHNKRNRLFIVVFTVVLLTILCIQVLYSRRKENYLKLCEKYNILAQEYNEKAECYNLLIQEAEKHKLVDGLEPAKKEMILNEEYAGYIKTDPNLKGLRTNITSLEEKNIALGENYEKYSLITYNKAIENYNIVADEYNEIIKKTSIDFIKDMPGSYDLRKGIDNYKDISVMENYSAVLGEVKKVINETDMLIADYLMIKQITNPSEEWVIERLSDVDTVKTIQAVSAGKDPNGLLGKDGGYTACIYFSTQNIDEGAVPGKDIVEKGTDVGGAIEVYDTLEHALN